MQRAVVFTVFLLVAQASAARAESPGTDRQDSGRVPSPSQEPAGGGATGLRVFLDCDVGCDFDYLRREVTFVNYVRDREDAQVHVLVTTRQSGGGTEWTFAFIGQQELTGVETTLEYNSSATDTQDEVREGYAQVLRIGLLRFIVDTPLADQIEIRQRPSDVASSRAAPEDDPWNFWVFRAEFSADVEAEQRADEASVNGEFSADRTTEQWKLRGEIDGEFSEETFELSDGGMLVSDSREWEVSGQVVRSLGRHWGASVRGGAEASTFVNEDLVVSVAPGIEYNIFPFAESSRRLLTLTYEVGYSRIQYEEVTLFDVTEETLYDHTLLTQYAVTQPWGQASASVLVGQFLNQRAQYRAEFAGNLDFRITRGLSVFFNGEYSLVRDQRFIPKEDISDEEVLLERRALATDFQYEVSIGFSYTFGSIFNNVVNPRFEGRRGGGFFF